MTCLGDRQNQMEVPLVNTDILHWTQVQVPSEYDAAGAFCPVAEDCAGGVERACTGTTAGSNASIIWRIHKDRPSELELLGLSAYQDLHERGLRLEFEDSLSPYVVITPSKVEASAGLCYQALVITVSGILYVVRIMISLSSNKGVFVPESGVLEHDLSNHLTRLQQVTSFTASSDMICIGGQNGAILCIPLTGQLNDLEDRLFELKDGDAGLSRLWGLVTRGKPAGPVVGLAARLVNSIPTLIALHEEGTLRTWDLVHRSRLLQHAMSPADLPGFSPQMMWVEEPPSSTASVKLAILYGSEDSRQVIIICSLNRSQGEVGNRLSNVILQHAFPVDQGLVTDIKLVNSRLWILRCAGTEVFKVHKLYCANLLTVGKGSEGVQNCFLQEVSVRDHLLQGPGHVWDDTLFAVHQLRQDVPGMSEVTIADIFLRRLLQPEVFQFSALQEVLQRGGAQIGDVELLSLSYESLKKEITGVVQSGGSKENRARSLEEWTRFAEDYLTVWSRKSVPYGLFSDAATGCMGLIRRNSISFMRSLTGVEQHVHGGLAEVEGVPLSLEWQEAHDSAVLAGVLRCTDTISRHLGRLALAAFHEALLRPVDNTYTSLTTTFMSILDVGYSPKILRNEDPYVGVDEARERDREHHERQRKFALHICQSLQVLQEKAGSWEEVVNVIEKYAAYLVSGLRSPVPVNESNSCVSGSFYKKMLVHGTSQISLVHFEAARNVLLLLAYMVKVRWQVGLTSRHVSKIQLELMPQVQEALTVGLLVHWLTVTSAEAPPPEDFSSQLSSLRIDGPPVNGMEARKVVWEHTLADILASTYLDQTEFDNIASYQVLPPPEVLLGHVIHFVSWLLWGNSKEQPATFAGRAITLSTLLLQHGQYGVLESFIQSVDKFSSQQKLVNNVGSTDGTWSARLHLLGFSLLARACAGRQNSLREKQTEDAIQCFFRAASGIGEANDVLQALFVGSGQLQSFPGGASAAAAWKLHYFEWIMQIFERYSLNDGARKFAHAALEQVDEAMSHSGDSAVVDSIKGRLWANIFKFSLDLELYKDAYCAIVSNPDGESKHTCLRRFVVVLCETKAAEVLCGDELPYVGLLEEVEQELALKAENSGIKTNPSPYKLLYAFHMHRHNWRRAAVYIYQYAFRIRVEGIFKSSAQATFLLQEQLNGLSAAMNALRLVESSNAWIECLAASKSSEWPSPTKRPRITSGSSEEVERPAARRVVDLKQLEKEYALTFARLQLVLSDSGHPIPGEGSAPAEMVHSLVEHGLYESAFSLLFLFWKDSSLKRELETVFQTMARKCCTLQLQEASPNSGKANLQAPARLLLTNAPGSGVSDGLELVTRLPATTNASCAWQDLHSYLTKYASAYPRLPEVVAETILWSNKNMVLPLWLVDIFRGGRHPSEHGMAGQAADPASLLRVYLDFDRVAEATTFLLESFQAWANSRPADVIRRKRTCSVWFPYTLIDRLIARLSELASGERPDQYRSLHSSLEAALQNHFMQTQIDSEDILSLSHSNGIESR